VRATKQLRRLWREEGGFGPTALSVVASPLAVLFGTAVRIRNFLYNLGALPSSSAALPVISIGNLAVGGTGKTPLSGWLIRELVRRGWKPAVVTGGYGEDEILLHRRWNPEVPVIVAQRRLDGARESLGLGRDIVVVDDGFQHRRIKREVDIVLLSPAHRLPPRLLPRGPFREPLEALRRAQFVLVIAKGGCQLKSARTLVAELRRMPGIPRVEIFSLQPGEWETLDGKPETPPAGSPLAVSSIAEPEGFFRIVEEKLGVKPELFSFPDHHRYTEGEVLHISERAGSRWIATTEKDAVKLVSFRELLPTVRVLPLVPIVGDEFADQFLWPLGTSSPSQELE
jgi:tetraacyldisaccharide 4'-kinase